MPSDFGNLGNYPNPFNSCTTIRFSLSGKTTVQLAIYTITGQHVRTLINETKSTGNYEVPWDGTNEKGEKVASGIFLVYLKTEKTIQAHSMILLK